MDNKLSELSKPVQIFKHPSGRNFWSVSADSNAGHQGVEPFYSQEYVSALLAELEASKQDAKERDAENESLALTVGRLRVELHNEGAANAHAYERIRGLEKQMATPVRLPPLMDGELFGKNSTTANAHNNAITACSIAIRGAGFKSEATALKCVGDE